MEILVLNSGSSSLKESLYEIGDTLPEGHPLPLWGERQMRVGENSIEPLFFRIRIQSMSGLRATDEKERRG